MLPQFVIDLNRDEANQNGRLKKTEYFFAKILGIEPWVSRNNWCEGHGRGGYRIMKHTLGQLGTKKGK